MSKSHNCELPFRNVPYASVLPKLAPNAGWTSKCIRTVRKLRLMNHNHFKCKRLFRSVHAVLAEKTRHVKGPHHFVIHPLSRLNTALELWFFLLWSYAIVIEPLMIYLNEVSELWWFGNVALSTSRLIFIALSFNVGYVDKNTKSVVLDPRIIIPRYLKGYFVFDVLATHYSLEYPADFLVTDRTLRVKLKMAAYVVRTLASCARLRTLLELLNERLASFGCRRGVRYLAVYAVRTLVYLHLCAFLVYLVPRVTYAGGATPPYSWISQANLEERGSISASHKYFECLMMASCYFFGLHLTYDLYVLNEQVCFVVVTLFGRLYTLFLLADVLNHMGITGISESKYESRMSMLGVYMDQQMLPESTRQRMWKYCKFKFQGRYFMEEAILNTLSDVLRGEVLLFSARCVVQKVSIFKKVSDFTLAAMLAAMDARFYSPGDVVIKLGAVVEEIYFISSGTVAFLTSRNDELCHLEDGEMFGISCLVVKKPFFTVVAVEATQVYVIDKERLLKFLDGELTKGLYGMAMHRLDMLRSLSDSYIGDKNDVLSQLRRGYLLEKSRKRVVPHPTH